jgi:polyribonucleotide nucleotidyltransferase
MIQFNQQKVSTNYNNSEEVTIETGKLARQADGAVLIKKGNCYILATVCATDKPKEGIDFFPFNCRISRKICRCR